MLNKIVYGRAECGEPCRIEISNDLIQRINEFHDVFKTLDARGISLQEHEHLKFTIRGVKATVWDPHEEERDFFIEVSDDSGFMIMYYGHECMESTFYGSLSELQDVEVTEDLLRNMLNDDAFDGMYREMMEQFFEDIPEAHKLLILSKVPALREKHEQDVRECEERMKQWRETRDITQDDGPIA